MLGLWEKRPPELRSLFNPAFCSVLIALAVKEYESERDAGGMPLLMTHLLLPITLHTETRESLPSTTHTSVTHWVGQNPQLNVGFAERVIAFRSITMEAIRFAIVGGILRFNQSGELMHLPGKPRKPRGIAPVSEASPEVAGCFKATRDLGRWFARVPDTTFLFRLFRIQP